MGKSQDMLTLDRILVQHESKQEDMERRKEWLFSVPTIYDKQRKGKGEGNKENLHTPSCNLPSTSDHDWAGSEVPRTHKSYLFCILNFFAISVFTSAHCFALNVGPYGIWIGPQIHGFTATRAFRAHHVQT